MGWCSGRDDRLRELFHKLLVAAPSRDLAAGWQLAVDVGRPAAPLLWEMLREERSHLGRKLAVLVAAVLAGGEREDDRLFAWLDQQDPMIEERAIVAILFALGPRRSRPMPNFWGRCLGPTKTPGQILSIAARLAAARFPNTEQGALPLADDDPGQAGAAAFAGLPVPTGLAARLWSIRTAPRYVDLFGRGALLGGVRRRGDDPTAQDGLLERARELSTFVGEQGTAVRAAALLLRMRADDQRPVGPRLEWQLLELAAAESPAARAQQPWLAAVPQPRDEDPRRLAVCYVLSREPATVIAERAQWAGEPRLGPEADIRRHIAVALAWRLLGDTEGAAANQVAAASLAADLPGVPEWALVRWAAGGAIEPSTTVADPRLRALVEVAAARRLPRQAARTALEEALWRWGSHPGLGLWQQERLLLRDLLLVGSNPGGSRYQPQVPPEKRYRPTGFGPDHVLFEVAVALYDFLAQPRGGVPPEYRLR